MSDSLWPHGLYSPWNSPGQNTRVGRHSLLQGNFPMQGLNPGLPHCRQILYQMSHQGSSEWVKGMDKCAGDPDFHSHCTTHNHMTISSSVAQSCPALFDPMDSARQASLSITNPWSLLKLMPIKSVMPSNHLILCCPHPLPPSIFPRIRVFSNVSVLCIKWPTYMHFKFQ